MLDSFVEFSYMSILTHSNPCTLHKVPSKPLVTLLCYMP